MEKLKVAWICHFSNEEIRSKLPLSEMKLKNLVKRLLGKRIENSYIDFAPWVTNLIKEFEKFDDIELHIIAPFVGLKRFTFQFEKNGIFYHFYKPDLPLLNISLYDKFDKHYWFAKTALIPNRLLVKRFLNKTKPDIVNLIGTENPYYSITALDIENIPVYVSAQTVYSNPARKILSDSCYNVNWQIELEIHKKVRYYGCGGRMHRDLINKNNSEAIIFKMFFAIEKPKEVKEVPKIFDFVFFAGLSKKKGVEDLIEALALVKKSKKDVKLNIVGRTTQGYLDLLKNKIKDLNLIGNISLTDYFTNHDEMHQHIVQARFAVLPVKLDIIPGSVIEAMFLKLPLVTYKTSGTPFLNKDGETVLLSEIGDIIGLASNMKKLLDSPELAKTLAENAKKFAEKEFDNTESANRLITNYKAVIENYNNNTPIPTEQLFDINEFPLY